uniref:Nucleoporin Nup188 N-terminal subdomain III domain-containing protein n=1 Tax=Timema cristinae TaxID=61476 RepID=A0A7R9CAM5_TIMCR|nr:unnamed protein product [Timema cristinae]
MIGEEPTELSSIAHDLIYKLLHWIIHHNIRDGLDSQPLYKCVTTALVHPEFKKHFWTEDQDRGLHILFIEASRKFPVDFLSFSSLIELLSRDEHSIVSNISYGVQNLQPKTVANLTVSMKILANIVHSGFIVDGDMVLPVEAALELMAKFTDVLEPPNQLLANCLDIVTYLWMDYRDEMYFKLDTIKFLPHVNSLNISPISCINGKFHCGGSLGPIVVVQEFSSAEYPLLKSFLQFVQVLLEFDPETVTKFEKVGNDYSDKLKYTIEKNFKLLLPAMSYILFEVFPTYNNWRYKKDEDHSFISRSCLSIFHKLISIDTRKDIINYLTPGEVLHLMCFYNLLEGGATFPLLKIVGTGNGTLQLLMESQLNWDTGPGVDFINLVRLAMALLNMTLRLKTTKDMDYLCPLEAKIMYYPNDKNHLRILHSTVDYIYHTFNPNLPTLAVELMRSFAMYPKIAYGSVYNAVMKLLHTLWLHRKELALKFLRRSDNFWINFCSPLLQNPLVGRNPKPSENGREFINSHRSGGMDPFSKSFKRETKQRHCTRVLADLSLLISLVESRLLCSLANLVTGIGSGYGTEAYIHMFDLLALEIYFKSGKLDNLLTLCLKNFFKESHKTLEMWTLFVTTSLKEAKKEMRYPDNASKIATKVMTSFKDFITIIITYMPDLITRNEVGESEILEQVEAAADIDSTSVNMNDSDWDERNLEDQENPSQPQHIYAEIPGRGAHKLYLAGLKEEKRIEAERKKQDQEDKEKIKKPKVSSDLENRESACSGKSLGKKSVITCINRLVAMLNNPSYVKDALENRAKQFIIQYHQDAKSAGLRQLLSSSSVKANDNGDFFHIPHNLATSSALTSLNSPSLLVHVMMLLYWLLINSSNKNCHNVCHICIRGFPSNILQEALRAISGTPLESLLEWTGQQGIVVQTQVKYTERERERFFLHGSMQMLRFYSVDAFILTSWMECCRMGAPSNHKQR